MKKKNVLLILKVLMIMGTTSLTAQHATSEKAKPYLDIFERSVTIPDEYQFHSVKEVTVDGISARLFRFEKNKNKGLEGEHFSFIISEEEKQILGFTNMDKKYTNYQLLSKTETERIAKEFLSNLDNSLIGDLKNLWIERHDEEIIIDGQKHVLSGMKYKCYRPSENDYAWVIVGFDGSVTTFERNIKWNIDAHKRITEQWLHDSWQKELKNEIQTDEEAIRDIVEKGFANGALNKLDTDAMREVFHPDFAILIANGNNLNRLFLSDWVKLVEEYKKSSEQMDSGVRNLEYNIEVMEITDKIAMVKIEFFRNKQLIITDYLSFIKFPDGWKAVGKVSNEHISNPLHLKF